jgi:hypothetical protein
VGNGKDRRRYRKAGRGRRERRRNANVLEATFDLATVLGNAGRGSTERVELARNEVLRLGAASTAGEPKPD